MLSIVGCSGSHVVDVVVGDKRIMGVDDNSSRIDYVICESSLVNDCDDFGGLLLSFYSKPEKVLLSASWKGIIHSVGQKFEGGVSAFRIVLANYAIECGFAVNYLKNDATRVTAECMIKSSTGCKWFVHGRVLMNSGVDRARGGCLVILQLLLTNFDGTLKRGHYKGHLLATTSNDGNQVKCAYAPNVASFQHYMEKLRRIARNGKVDSMLDGLQNNKWANAFFRGKRYGEMSSNAAESYNNWIGGTRELPITCMVDMIRVQIMTQLSNKRAESKRWTTKFCPVMKKKLVDALKLAKSWNVIVASDTVLEVHSSISFYVDIGRQTCSCHEWQLNGFPCCHVVHALRSSGRNLYDFIDHFFHVDCFRESYKEFVYLVPSSERFDFDGADSSIIKPPITKK
ncbi:hypothetical protein ACSBR2_005545 [Camellia fascicularis]